MNRRQLAEATQFSLRFKPNISVLGLKVLKRSPIYRTGLKRLLALDTICALYTTGFVRKCNLIFVSIKIALKIIRRNSQFIGAICGIDASTSRKSSHKVLVV